MVPLGVALGGRDGAERHAGGEGMVGIDRFDDLVPRMREADHQFGHQAGGADRRRQHGGPGVGLHLERKEAVAQVAHLFARDAKADDLLGARVGDVVLM